MGTITRNFANNLTTSGLLKPDAFNNDSFDNVTAVPSGSVETGDMQFISSATASASASIEFTSGIDSTYPIYRFEFINVHGSANANFEFQGSTNGGSSYGVTMTTTQVQAWHNEADTDTSLTYSSGNDLAQSTSFQRLCKVTGSTNADDSGSGILTLYNPSSTTFVKHFMSDANGSNGGYTQREFAAGYFNTTSAINAIQFRFVSGNIDAGQILLFGIN
jgi:hypothetical protein